MDVPVAVLFILAVVPLFVALGDVQTVGYFDAFMIAMPGVSVASFATFLLAEKK